MATIFSRNDRFMRQAAASLGVILAAAFAQLGRDESADRAAAQVRRLDPFFETATYGTGFTVAEDREKIVAGLRKAGLK